MLRKYLVIWLVASSSLAWAWPRLFSGIDPFVASRPYLPLVIAITMFAIGSLLPRNEVQQVIRRWPLVLGGTAVQYTTMPALAWAIGRLFHLPSDAMLGVIMVGCVPGAMASNVLTLAARGNVSYSVSLTTSATLLSPIIVPLAMMLTLGASLQEVAAHVSPLQVSVNLLLTVVLPVVTGHLVTRYSSRSRHVADLLAEQAANLAILWIIAVVVGLNRERLASASPAVMAALLAVNMSGYAAGFLAARPLGLTASMRRALTLEVGMQNAGLGTVLTLQLFPGHEAAAIPPALYTFGCMITGTLLAQSWAQRPIQNTSAAVSPAISSSGVDGTE